MSNSWAGAKSSCASWQAVERHAHLSIVVPANLDAAAGNALIP